MLSIASELTAPLREEFHLCGNYFAHTDVRVDGELHGKRGESGMINTNGHGMNGCIREE